MYRPRRLTPPTHIPYIWYMQKKVTVSVDEEEYARLRAKLVLAGSNFNEWVRELIRKELAVHE